MNSRVVSLFFDPASRPTVTLQNGSSLSADLVIGADGVNSIMRDFVVGHPDRPIPTGDAAYRAIISTEDMLNDDLLKDLVDYPEMTCWMGPFVSIQSYEPR